MHLIFTNCQEIYLFIVRNSGVHCAKYKFFIMKLFYLICFLTLSGILQANTLVGQDLNKIVVSLELQQTSLKEALKQIEQQTKIRFTYKSEDITTFKPITYQKNNQKLVDVLQEFFSNTGLSYEEIGTNVLVIRKASVNPPNAADETAAAVILRGKITDDKGLPIPGANVLIKGTNNGAVTAQDGSYTLNAQQNSGVLVVSFIGYIKKELNFSGAGTYNVVLLSDAKSLNEVVVIGYGETTKKDLTGAVGQVNISDMMKAPVGSFAEALAGRVAGVQVSGNDGQPGGQINITIRGPGSLTQSTSPLYVIDGFPVEDLDPNSLNLDDIESISILKDASAAAIYGSRAANGVVLIQTKRGKAGKTQITFNPSWGKSLRLKEIELMSPYEYVKLQNEQFPGQQYAAEYIANTPLDYYKGIQGVDMQEYVITDGAVSKYDMAIRGGNDKTKFAISGSLWDQKGVVINTGLDKYTGRLVLDHTVNNKLKVGITTNYSGVHTSGQQISANAATGATQTSLSSFVMYRVWGWRPVNPPFITADIIGEDVDEFANITGDYRINPVADLENVYNHVYSNVLTANGYASYNILKGLDLKITGGVNRIAVNSEQFYNSKTSAGSSSNVNNPNGVNGYTTNVSRNSWSNENILNYTKIFNKVHSLKGLALFSLFRENLASRGYGGRLLPNEVLGMAGLEQGLSFNPIASASDNSRISYATRWDYSYKSKYLLSGTFRADGSSKFKKPWGYFPAVSAGWNMQEEKFMKALPFISNSKLRASFGIVGNDRVGPFDWYAVMTQNINGYSFGNATPIAAAYISAIENPDLKWEKTTSIDLGYELGIFKNRVELTVDIYKKTTDDLLLRALLPPTSGFPNAFKNIGKISNEGLEFTLNTVNIKGKSFSWESNFNIAFNRNKVLELADGQRSIESTGTGFESQFNALPLYTAEIGKPAGMMLGQVWDGVYQYADFDSPAPGVYILKSTVPTNGAASRRPLILPGDAKYKDLNGDGIIDGNDKTIIGRGQPIHVGGFSNNLQYKGFSANIFFQWSVGNNIYNANRLTFEGNSNNRKNLNQYASYINRWSPENQTNENFRPGGHGLQFYHNSRVVEDGSYLRLKTVSLSYSLPLRYIQKVRLSKLSFNVAAQNLLTWTKYSGLDPEVSLRSGVLTPGYDFSAYPVSRTIVVGINAAF
jgi:TonB-linked SusC/RagA family outer membrane protein